MFSRSPATANAQGASRNLVSSHISCRDARADFLSTRPTVSGSNRDPVRYFCRRAAAGSSRRADRTKPLSDKGTRREGQRARPPCSFRVVLGSTHQDCEPAIGSRGEVLDRQRHELPTPAGGVEPYSDHHHVAEADQVFGADCSSWSRISAVMPSACFGRPDCAAALPL